MKARRLIAILLVFMSIGLLFTSCDMINDFIASRTRPIPLIQIYNANLEKTLKMVANDTLNVTVQGLAPDTEHTIRVLDPRGNTVSEVITVSDGEGKIGMTPLWYDIGFKFDNTTGRVYLDTADLSLKAFNIQVFDVEEEGEGETNFKLPFFFVNTNEDVERAQPIVVGGKVFTGDAGEEFSMTNVFYSFAQDLTLLDYGDFAADLTEAEKYTNELYVQVEQLENLAREAEDTDEVRIWILPHRSEPFEDGERLGQFAYFYQTFHVSDFTDAEGNLKSVLIYWPDIKPENTPVNVDELTKVSNGTYDAGEAMSTIPEWAEEHSFSIFLDMENKDQFGIYEVKKEGFTSYFLDAIDGNGVAGFIVRSHVQPSAELIRLELASNGYYNGDWHWYITDNGYVDTFNQNGYDTFYYPARGIHISWNPYIYRPGYFNRPPNDGVLNPYWGAYVDVYIVDATHALATDTPIQLADYAYRSRIPIQVSCRNGAMMQVIWRAPYGGYSNGEVVGNYMVIVDMDRSGTITDGDLVDNVLTTDVIDYSAPVTASPGFSIFMN